MGTSSHKRRVQKTSLRKKVKQLQKERDELKAKLQEYEMERDALKAKLQEYEKEMKVKTHHFEHSEKELQETIRSLESELRESTGAYTKTPDLRNKISNWMFGVFFTIWPFVANLMYYIEYGTLVDIISNFLLVLHAISVNLMIIISDDMNYDFFNRIIKKISIFLALVSFQCSVILPFFSTYLGIVISKSIETNTILYFIASCVILVIVLGIVTIKRQSIDITI